MNHWISIGVVIEAMALLSWLSAATTRQVKFAFLFGFNVMAPVACLHSAAGGRLD